MNRRLRRLLALGVVLSLTLLLGACGDDDDDDAAPSGGGQAQTDVNPDNKKVKIAFSAPGADHGWLAAITKNARDEAAKFDDVELILLEGTNDSAAQVAQIESLVSQKPDALIILPHEGDPLTPAAKKVMDAGIPVINLDREFATAEAYRTWLGGDNYGIGVAAGNYIADQLK